MPDSQIMKIIKKIGVLVVILFACLTAKAGDNIVSTTSWWWPYYAIAQNEYATVTVHGNPNTSYQLRETYNGTNPIDTGFRSLTTDGNGVWTETVGIGLPDPGWSSGVYSFTLESNAGLLLDQGAITQAKGTWDKTNTTGLPDSTVVFNLYGVPQVKPPQPLTFHWTNRSTKNITFQLHRPDGHVVLEEIADGGSIGVDTYTPSANGPFGDYYFTFVVGSQTFTAGQSMFNDIGDSNFGQTWSTPNLYFTLDEPGSAGNGSSGGPNGSVTNNDAVAHVLQWVDSASGQNAGPPITVAPGATYNPAAGDIPSGPPGTQGNYKLVDTTTGGTLGNVGRYTPTDNIGQDRLIGSVIGTINPPAAPQPSPTSGQSQGGNLSDGNQGFGSGGHTTVNNSNTSISGGTTGATNQDIYNDVKQSIMDAEQAAGDDAQRAADSVDETVPSDIQVPDYSARDQAFQDVQSHVDEEASGAADKYRPPVSVGGASVSSSWSIPAIGPLQSWTVDLSRFSTGISVFRAMCLVAVTFIFYKASGNALDKAVGGEG